MNKLCAIICFVLLADCGSSSGPRQVSPQPSWNGGIYAVWSPVGQSKAILILHQGHAAFNSPLTPDGWFDLSVVAKSFVESGYTVVGFEMPPMPHNGRDITDFYLPVLSFIDSVPEDVKIYMAGFSGGGWTTTVSTAFSARIKKGYSVQGDAPHYPGTARCAVLASDPLATDGFEQCNPPKPYLELYETAGPRLLHIYTDKGGFALSGFPQTPSWPYVSDPTATDHSWTQWTTDFILNDIEINLSEFP